MPRNTSDDDRPLEAAFDKVFREEALRHTMIESLPLRTREKRFLVALDTIAHERRHDAIVRVTLEGRTCVIVSNLRLRIAMNASLDTVRRARDGASRTPFLHVKASDNAPHEHTTDWPAIWRHFNGESVDVPAGGRKGGRSSPRGGSHFCEGGVAKRIPSPP